MVVSAKTKDRRLLACVHAGRPSVPPRARRCRASSEAMYYNFYYATYYADYYGEYYQRYYTDAVLQVRGRACTCMLCRLCT